MQMSRKKIRILKLAVAGFVAAMGFAAFCNWQVEAGAQGRIFTDPNHVPQERIGLVLGTDKFWHGRVSDYYRTRIDAAARLYHSGKVAKLIVSGNPWDPGMMRESLMAQGVPSEDIILDGGGYRTLASIVRARDVFKSKSFIVISQADHCARAIYLAKLCGCNAVGFAAPDPRHPKNIVREFFARPKAVLDMLVLHRAAREAARGAQADGKK
jgi:SanA protein